MRDISYKKVLAEQLSKILHGLSERSKNGQNLNLLIFTNFGHIQVSDVVDFFSGRGDAVQIVLAEGIASANDECNRLKDIDRDLTITEQSYLLLRNAKITPCGSKEPAHIISDMLLFADQIVRSVLGSAFIPFENQGSFFFG